MEIPNLSHYYSYFVDLLDGISAGGEGQEGQEQLDTSKVIGNAISW